jgi:hypothetical protein
MVEVPVIKTPAREGSRTRLQSEVYRYNRTYSNSSQCLGSKRELVRERRSKNLDK